LDLLFVAGFHRYDRRIYVVGVKELVDLFGKGFECFVGNKFNNRSFRRCCRRLFILLRSFFVGFWRDIIGGNFDLVRLIGSFWLLDRFDRFCIGLFRRRWCGRSFRFVLVIPGLAPNYQRRSNLEAIAARLSVLLLPELLRVRSFPMLNLLA
jgi:hypothetical protein